MALVSIDESSLRAVADRIRAKGSNKELLYFPDGFLSAIDAIGKLPELTNPATAMLIAKDKEAIDADGNMIVGSMEETTITPMIMVNGDSIEYGGIAGSESPTYLSELKYVMKSIKADELEANLKAENIKEGVTIFGVNGTYSNKLAQVLDGSVTELTAEDMYGAITIHPWAFMNCPNLERLVFPDTVTTLGIMIISNCPKLTSITIPASVTSIGVSALAGAGSAENKVTITMLSKTPPTADMNIFNVNNLNKIIVPLGARSAYIAATNWADYADYIEEA